VNLSPRDQRKVANFNMRVRPARQRGQQARRRRLAEFKALPPLRSAPAKT
jgi:hypothetical protein